MKTGFDIIAEILLEALASENGQATETPKEEAPSGVKLKKPAKRRRPPTGSERP